MRDNQDLNLAVLIDADNIPYSNVKGMLDEISKFGIPSIKRIYGDWTKPTVSGWKPALLQHAITPVQQYSYTTGKNATDSAMIIDAMDILHREHVDGFCIVSSDSDFTRLATRLRESSKLVIGIGEKKTPKPFIVACDKFIYLEILANPEGNTKEPTTKTTKANTNTKTDNEVDKVDKKLINLIKASINDIADDSGWAFMAQVGSLVNKKRPDFDPRNYGFPKLTPMIKSLNKVFEIDEQDVDGRRKNIKHVFVRIKGK